MDTILESWLRAQKTELDSFLPQTDRVKVIPLDGSSSPRRYVAEFACNGLVRESNGSTSETDRFAVGIYFGDDHLRRVQPTSLVWLLAPTNVWHPNVMCPGLCVGHLRPGVAIVDILYQTYSILTWQNFNLRDYLNPEAAEWARSNMSRFPIDREPLKRRTTDSAGGN